MLKFKRKFRRLKVNHDIIKGMNALCILPYTVYSNNQADGAKGNMATDGLCIIRFYSVALIILSENNKINEI